ncbi:MAG TPA: ABC transporter permease [Humibacter sp.]|nr:ABC transporter permease [Humibacter sp.]
MFATYLRRELVNRRKQTIIIAVGMALAIALVIIVNSVSAGVSNAQAQVLQSVYGVGTDITITQPATAATTAGGQGPRFDFGANSGSKSGSSRTVDSSRLAVGRGTQTMPASSLKTVTGVHDVSAASAVLSLQNTTFNGTLPNFAQVRNGQFGRRNGTGSTGSTPAPTGGADGKGGSSFKVDSFSVMGLTPGADAVGPLSATKLAKGRSLGASDVGKDVVVLDSSYAKGASKVVGDTMTIGGKTFTVVGLIAPTGSDSQTASNAYIPLDVAQTLSGQAGKISAVYVQASSASAIDGLKTSLQKAMPKATISTQADLASSVSGSLGSASQLIANLGSWLSLIVLAAAFLIAILFTISGVTRRTREFGTLKAIGWRNRRIVGQVAGESVVQGLIGGIAGVAIGLIGVLIVNLVSPTLSGSVGSATTNAAARFGQDGAGGALPGAVPTAGGFAGGAFGGAFRGARQAAASTTDVVLNAPITVWIIVIAVGLAILGGLLAGAIGGWRAARLRPAEALRSVA